MSEASRESRARRDLTMLASADSHERFRFVTTRPVAVLMVFLAVVVFGAFSIRLLPLNLMPDISYPKLTVRTEYPGAAPAEVENNVSRPLEEILGVVTGLTRIESVSRAGFSDVVLEFTWDTDMDDANQDVLEKIDTIKAALPEEVKQPLILRYDPNLDPVLTMSVSGGGARFEGIEGLKFLRRIADRDVRRLLEPVEGVAAVKVKGGLEEEIRVELDEDALRRTNIGIVTVINRLAAENINLAGGSMRDGRTRYLVRTVNEFRSLDDIRDTVIVSREGRDVKLRHIGSVSSGYEDRDVITRIDGKEAVEVEIYKEADANVVEMAKLVRERIQSKVVPRLRDDYGATTTVISDRSTFIESSVASVRDAAVSGGLLAIVILFLFLRDIKSTVIIALSIPISVLVTFAPMNLAGVSLNIMSLGGLALGVGMLVDNSIVVLESIHRCRQDGDDVLTATVRGTSEVGTAVTASTLTTIAVFFPMVFVEGVAGQMFGDLGLAIVFSLLASLAVALFFIPMLASRTVTVRSPGTVAAGVWRSIVSTWASWEAWRDLLAGVRGWTWIRFALIVPLVYVLLRFLVQLVFELVGKLLTTIFVVLALVVSVVVVSIGRVFALLLRPALWAFNVGVEGLERGYPVVIRWAVRNAAFVYALCLLSFGFVAWGIARLDTELIPEMHQGEFTVELNLPVGTPIEQTDALVQPIEARAMDRVPQLQSLTTTIGSERDDVDASERGEHTARLRINLRSIVPLAQAGKADAEAGKADAEAGKADAEAATSPPPAQSAIDRLQALWSQWTSAAPRDAPADPVLAEARAIEAMRSLIGNIPDLAINITRPALFSFKTPIEIEVRGYDLDELALVTQRIAGEMSQLPELRDVKSSIQAGSPEIQIVYDRDTLARMGLDIRTVAELVRDKVQGNEATQYSRKERKVPVLVRVQGITTAGVEQLRQLVVNPGAAHPVPLEAVAKIEVGRGPNEIRRIGQQRVGLVTANLQGVALGGASQEIREKLAVLEDGLPKTVTTAVTGQSEEWETSARSLYLALGLSIFLVYVIMAAQFESLVYPLIILVTIPLALVGVVAAFLLLELPVSVLVFLGTILLAGIVVNNAIVLVDYVNQLKDRGLETLEALELAGRVRLRPILMTTSTTVLGLLPMALGLGDGTELRMPMAVTVIAGLTFSTLLTLIVIPTLYSTVDRMRGGVTPGSTAIALAREVAEVRADQLAPEIEATPPGATGEEDGGVHPQ